MHPTAPIERVDIAAVNSNDPIEDYHSENRFKTAAIFGVFDGHGGPDCGAVISTHLPSYVAHAMSKLPPPKFDRDGLMTTDHKRLIATTLKEAFKRLDADVVNAGIPPLKPLSPDASVEQQVRARLMPALTGSCALLAYIEGNDVFVCCTGDSRAVLGRRVSGAEGAADAYQAIDLSADQTVKNPSEYNRLIDEHPGEMETVAVKGRVLGGLMPTRAFGDSRYKWPIDVQTKVLPWITARGLPRNYKTPPYVTAEPEVTHYTLDPARDRFLVLATDGLYDELTSDEVVSVVASRISGSNAAFNTGKWLHVDDNAATDLIRNALGGADVEKTRKLLSIPAPYSRRFRDDMTVNVIFFGDKENPAGVPGTVDGERPNWREGMEEVDLGRAGSKTHTIRKIMEMKGQAKL
ncbi:hypothetical protein HK101_004231 [Irineochytrium annulatum]|nr:hypothetical protein HK101_004231 [Irineochytrium annulatum]